MGVSCSDRRAAAARLESSKAFAKAFMVRHGVPTARFQTCESVDDALETIRSGRFGFPVVLKADGLAAGKGVVIADDRAIGRSRCRERDARPPFWRGRRSTRHRRMPDGTGSVVLRGQRRRTSGPIGTAQDHKRVFDDDRGPNTGGMGAFAPSPLIDGALEARIMKEIVQPVDRRDGRRRSSISRLSVRRPDAHDRRSKGDRVQRAAR